MGTSLTGTKIRDTYDALIKVSDNGALDGTLQVLTDGLGNNSALSLSTAGASVGGTLAVSGGITGTLSTAAQPNITSVGTLSSLAVTGAATLSSLTTVNIGVQGGNVLVLDKLSGANIAFNAAGVYSGQIDCNSSGVLQLSSRSTYRALSIKDGGDISFRDSSANEAFYWDASAARLGIGLTTPSDGIEVSNGGIKVSPNPTALAAGYNASFTTFYGEEVLQMLVNGNKAITVKGYNIPSSLHFYTYSGGASAERMRITSGGYLKASNNGTYANAAGNNHELVTNVGGTEGLVFTNSSLDPYGSLFRYSQTTPNNSVNDFLQCTDLSATRLRILSNGGISNYQANDTNLSDERVKTDVSPLGSYWDKIKAIEIVNFKYKDQTHDDFNIGVIAQQVESVAPEFVDIDGFDNRPKLISEEVLDEEGNVIEEAVYEEPLAEPLKAVYTADLYHAAIKVLQEAMARIEVLETELNALKQA